MMPFSHRSSFIVHRWRHQLIVTRMEMMHAVFALGGEAAAVVGRGAEAALDGLANIAVFHLDLVAEGDTLVELGPAGFWVFEVPVEKRDGPFRSERQNQIRGGVVGVD